MYIYNVHPHLPVVGGGGAYPLTKQYFQLENDTIAFKLGDQVYCYLVLPCLLGYGKRLPAYQTVYILGIGGKPEIRL